MKIRSPVLFPPWPRQSWSLPQSALWEVIGPVGDNVRWRHSIELLLCSDAEQKCSTDHLIPLKEISAGNIDVTIPPITNNEFGQINKALTVFKDSIEQRVSDGAERAKILQVMQNELQKLSSGNLVDLITDPFAGDYENLRVDFNNAKRSIRGSVYASHHLRHSTQWQFR